MKIIHHLLLTFAAIAALMCSCGTKDAHFITDEAYRAQVDADFKAKKELLPRGDLFAVFDQDLTTAEREALQFLYAYMPISDVTDVDGQIYLDAVRTAFAARQEMPWGKDIPEREFRHFVLPVSVNNEDIDSARTVFYKELKARVSNMTLRDAILEINHWCHEKVVYQPSDPRTSSPLATVKTAYGRCGEESTFTVAALRSVGIPARQVYTPRWAHTDDNHAWVEAWVDGKWHFLGACEPEPVLDLAWFNAPASRGMLMHTKVFGRYDGPEDVMSRNNMYTIINITDNYAPTSRIDVSVVDGDGNPAEGATVEYKVYNYAELFTVARKTADSEGKSFLTAGNGDMVIWASRDGHFGYRQVSFGKDKSVTIKLDRTAGESHPVNMDIVPPAEHPNMPKVTDEQREENNARLVEEDKIREAYISTFMTAEAAGDLADELGIDKEQFTGYIVKSRGNWQTIADFLRDTPQDKRQTAMQLLATLEDKDLRDVSIEVLDDNLYNTPQVDCYNWAGTVLRPRIEYEMLTPYKGYFAGHVPADLAKSFAADPQTLVEWCRDSIEICDEWNPAGDVISPIGVWRSHRSDWFSREIFFVAMARAMGVPAWKDPVTGKIQYMHGEKTIDADFASGEQKTSKLGTLRLKYNGPARLKNPKYYTHFTVSRIDGGRPVLLNYDEGSTWADTFKDGTPLDEGHYLLTTGTRLANGTVLANMTFFDIREGETTTTELTIRNDDSEVQVIGNFDSESKFETADGQGTASVLATTGRGYYVVAVLGAKEEPTNHFLKDLEKVSKEFEQWGRQMVFVFPSDKNYSNYNAGEFPGLPSTITYGIDIDNGIANKILDGMELKRPGALPLVIIADTFNRVVFVSQGYNIGTAERMLDVIHKL